MTSKRGPKGGPEGHSSDVMGGLCDGEGGWAAGAAEGDNEGLVDEAAVHEGRAACVPVRHHGGRGGGGGAGG